METGSLVTNLDVEISDSLALFAPEAERALSALFHSVRDSYGERAAFCVADGRLEILEACLASCRCELPKVRNITVQSITRFLVPCTERGRDAVAAFPSDIPEQ